MSFEMFQSWAQGASPSARADGVRALARAVLRADLGPARGDAVNGLTAFLDDPSSRVRAALAEAIGGAAHAPPHLIRALADDEPAIAAIVLGRSPVLTDAEIIDRAATAPPVVQLAVAGRPGLSAALAAALASVFAPDALAALAANPTATLDAATIRAMVARGGGSASLSEALLRRGELPGDVRLQLVGAASRALCDLVAERGWVSAARMERLTAEARDRAAVTIGAGVSGDERDMLAAHLRDAGELTTTLTFRVILSGRLDLFAASLAALTGMAGPRVEALLADCGAARFATLCRDAGLPDALLPAVRAAVRAAASIEEDRDSLSLPAVRQVIEACEGIAGPGLSSLMVLLRRFEAEAARNEARCWRDAAATRRTARAEPLLLADADGGDPRRAAPPDREEHKPRYTIDLAAIEAQLCAA